MNEQLELDENLNPQPSIAKQWSVSEDGLKYTFIINSDIYYHDSPCFGKDSTRFMMLSRSNDAELDFDFKKVTEKSKDNPVFYVQYAYARINSIFRALKVNLSKQIRLKDGDFNLNHH